MRNESHRSARSRTRRRAVVATQQFPSHLTQLLVHNSSSLTGYEWDRNTERAALKGYQC
jgi:hypothetical protein